MGYPEAGGIQGVVELEKILTRYWLISDEVGTKQINVAARICQNLIQLFGRVSMEYRHIRSAPTTPASIRLFNPPFLLLRLLRLLRPSHSPPHFSPISSAPAQTPTTSYHTTLRIATPIAALLRLPHLPRARCSFLKPQDVPYTISNSSCYIGSCSAFYR